MLFQQVLISIGRGGKMMTSDFKIISMEGLLDDCGTLRTASQELNDLVESLNNNLTKLDGYWQNEAVQDIPNNFIEFIKDVNIDIVCSHCAPNFIENDYKNIPQKYIDNDINLLNDIKTNQQILDDLFVKYLKNKISKWYYGHYHRDRFCVCDDIDFICIDRLKNNKISYRFNYEEIYQ